MKKIIGLLALSAGIAGALAAPVASAEEGSFVARVRAIRIQPSDNSKSIPALGITAKDVIDISNKTAPDIDFEYYFGGPLSVELLLTIPQKHDVTVKAGASRIAIGSFKHLPPTLTLKYNFNPDGAFRPYLGAGINYTKVMDVKLAVPGTTPLALDLQRNSFGVAVQAGADIKLADKWFASVDLKWIDIDANVKVRSSQAIVSQANVDPLVFGVGVGYRF